MRILRSIAPALLALLAVPAAADPIAALDEQENRRETGRQEIARILAADNVDASRLSAREVATAIRAIPRGAAPDDFWNAYQAHVRAWERAAAAEERAQGLIGGKPAEMERAVAAFVAAQAEISATFEQVRQIAGRYGVEMPIPPAEAANTI
ncbi:MAG TPA: hypothetical protein VD887_01775 [Allosphingosinicella sp.]|nr:hypothetical protein [Allosphingosinicella sp.]